MIVVIDNYDSFTYNLVQYLGELGEDLRVFRNDKITLEEIERLKPARIVISPGPGTPADAGITEDAVRHFHKSVPILGVCLGHQAIGEVFGGKIVRAPTLMHGKTSEIFHDGRRKKSPLELPQHMITDFIQKMIERADLTEAEARQAMEEIMSGQSTDAQVAGFLTALRMKGETSQELVGFAGVMREKAEPLWDGEVLPVLDTAGTG